MDEECPGPASEYTFENFLLGDSNSRAAAASKAVADDHGRSYNPLFIHAGAGLGKTHLLKAIAHRLCSLHKDKKTAYITTEEFVNDFVQCIQERKSARFKDHYESLDVLLIDDIQFIIGKQGLQEALSCTFRKILNRSGQIVISSDRFPKEIRIFFEGLCSGITSGHITEILSPEIETREAILMMKAREMGVQVPAEVITLIIRNMPSSIRELKAALIKIIADTSFQRKEIPVDLAGEIIMTLIPDRKSSVPEAIQEAVAGHFGIKKADLMGKIRQKHLFFPRQIAITLTAELTDLSPADIARIFDIDQPTLANASRRIKEKLKNLKTKEDTAYHLENIRVLLKKK